MNLVELNLYCCYAPRVIGSTLSLGGSGRRSIVAAMLKIHSDGADVTVIPSSRAAAFR